MSESTPTAPSTNGAGFTPTRSVWRSMRRTGTALVLVSATAVSIVGLAQALRSPGMSGASFNRAAFHQRLARTDLSQLSDEQLDEMARLLERDVTQGRLWLPEISADGPDAAEFHRNFDALAAHWARRQAADLATVPQEERNDFARRRGSALRRLLRAANYLDMRTLTMLAGREPPPAVMDLPRGWVHDELLRWERGAPAPERDELRRFRQSMEPQANRRGRRMGED